MATLGGARVGGLNRRKNEIAQREFNQMSRIRAASTSHQVVKERGGNNIHLSIRDGRVVGAMGADPKRFLGLSTSSAARVAAHQTGPKYGPKRPKMRGAAGGGSASGS